MEFGYLPKSNIETGNLRTEEQLRGAIKNLQVIFTTHYWTLNYRNTHAMVSIFTEIWWNTRNRSSGCCHEKVNTATKMWYAR